MTEKFTESPGEKLAEAAERVVKKFPVAALSRKSTIYLVSKALAAYRAAPAMDSPELYQAALTVVQQFESEDCIKELVWKNKYAFIFALRNLCFAVHESPARPTPERIPAMPSPERILEAMDYFYRKADLRDYVRTIECDNAQAVLSELRKAVKSGVRNLNGGKNDSLDR